MKHETGSLQAWLQRFDDAIEECETLGATLTDEMQRAYLMQNLNEKIYEQTLLLWRGVLTRTSFPQTYDALKGYITNEYSAQMTQVERAKVIYTVISHGKKKNELSMLAGERGKEGKDDKAKCHICGRENHKMKQCWYHDPAKTLDENKKIAQEKTKAKQEEKKKKKEERKKQADGGKSTDADDSKEKGVPHKGTYVQLPPKMEHAGMCLIRDACLYTEYSFSAGVHPNQVNFFGTVSGVVGVKEANILKMSQRKMY
jgi:hypothetical protein